MTVEEFRTWALAFIEEKRLKNVDCYDSRGAIAIADCEKMIDKMIKVKNYDPNLPFFIPKNASIYSRVAINSQNYIKSIMNRIREIARLRGSQKIRHSEELRQLELELMLYLFEKTALYYGYGKNDHKILLGKRRISEHVKVRQMSIYLITLYSETFIKLRTIGLFFNRDHSTIIHSSSTIEGLVSVNHTETIKDIENIQKML